jgi:hypothetical protein
MVRSWSGKEGKVLGSFELSPFRQVQTAEEDPQ